MNNIIINWFLGSSCLFHRCFLRSGFRIGTWYVSLICYYLFWWFPILFFVYLPTILAPLILRIPAWYLLVDQIGFIFHMAGAACWELKELLVYLRYFRVGPERFCAPKAERDHLRLWYRPTHLSEEVLYVSAIPAHIGPYEYTCME